MAARQAGGDLDVIDKEEDLEDNDSSVEDASDSDGQRCWWLPNWKFDQ